MPESSMKVWALLTVSTQSNTFQKKIKPVKQVEACGQGSLYPLGIGAREYDLSKKKHQQQPVAKFVKQVRLAGIPALVSRTTVQSLRGVLVMDKVFSSLISEAHKIK